MAEHSGLRLQGRFLGPLAYRSESPRRDDNRNHRQGERFESAGDRLIVFVAFGEVLAARNTFVG